ncbi:MAG: hypothetical protein A3D10_02910 [Omnitrophica WOR_2 bacterium RIFCSPHIGHO2_02_FULL_48_11]|nr:MAG: hypothetical protein A3D10_02910 [Omnitrophica WOR_2 bacterium RIFCSPHIGHO2_02_FULL_48_11]
MDIAILSFLKNTGIFAAVLSVLIVVHEWGHFITARKLGVKVERFALGFGPKLFSWVYDGTEFLLCLIPLGGYVKMAGDERANYHGAPDEFFSKSPGQRALIVLNGPVVNFVLAYVCLCFVFMLGYPDLAPKIGKVLENYPAQAAGLKPGDKVLSVNTQAVETWTDVQRNIAESKGSEIVFVILRDDKEIQKAIKPKIEDRKNIFGQRKTTPAVGIVPEEEIVVFKYPFGESLVRAYKKLVEVTVLTYKSIYYMITGSMSAKESMTGPIGIFYIVKAAADMGFSHLLYIVGIISASLAIFNLLPVIPLDGGHLFLLALEKIRGKALPEKVDEAIARLGFSLIICLALFVFYSDFSRFGLFEKISNIWR